MSCTYYEYKSGLFGGDYWCTKKDGQVDDNTYYKYCRDYSYDECPIYRHQESSGCFITTVACQILGLADQNPVLNNFRDFRDNILQKDPKYYDALKEYDVIGPVLADALVNDKERHAMAAGLYQHAILPIHQLIQKQEVDRAVEAYSVMTLMLVNYYGLKHSYNQIKEVGYDYLDFCPKQAGHGKKYVRRPKDE